jgi:hypothetical protein
MGAAMRRNPNQLKAVGPLASEYSFPLWYKDSSDTRLELALNPDDPFTPAMGDLQTPGSPVSFPANFPDEAFYMLVDARLTTGGMPAPGRARVVLALEAAFGGTGDVAAGQELVFGRVRVRLDGGVPGGRYVFTHPYGQTEALEADERGRVFVTEDLGGVPMIFTGALESEVGPFLRWTSGAAKLPGENDPPVGYLGDGVTQHSITGSVLGTNFFAIDGPNIAAAGGPRDPSDPTNPNRILTSLFTVQGKLATRAGVDVTRATYGRSGGSVTLDVFAASEPGQNIEVSGPVVPTTKLREHGNDYLARVSTGVSLPVSVEIRNDTDNPVSLKSSPVVDAVTISTCTYDASARTLTVDGASSDVDTPPVLTVVRFGALLGGSAVFAGIDAPPVRITVISSHGGSTTAEVTVAGAAFDPLPVIANAGADLVVQQGATVTLSATHVANAISTVWTQTAGPAVVLNQAATEVATFDAPAAGTSLVFVFTVDGPGGPSSDSVAVQVAALQAPVATILGVPSSAVGATVVLDGSTSVGAANFVWAQISGPPVGAITNANAPVAQFTMPAGPGAVVMRLTVSGPGGAPASSDTTVSMLIDLVTIDVAEFRTGKQQWRISGRATGSLPDRVVVALGPDEIGEAAVDATGAFDIRKTILPTQVALLPSPGDVLDLTTTRGAVLTAAVTIRS